MAILFIEPTPSPNTMKITLDAKLPDTTRLTYTKDQAADAPEPYNRLLAIEGVRSLYHASDFIALDRTPRGDWQHILAGARRVLGEAATPGGGKPAAEAANSEAAGADGLPDSQPPLSAFGEVSVKLQHFRGIPLQVRVSAGDEEKRAAMPERFTQAAIRAASASPNLIKERSLEEWDTRYGELDEVLDSIVQELDASYDDKRLEELAAQAASGKLAAGAEEVAAAARRSLSYEETERQLRSEDWKLRYAALEQIKPSAETMPLLILALDDAQTAVRRLATVYLGDLKDPVVLPYLYRALQDKSASVRRTAGDTLSDIGDPAAQAAMIGALGDANKLVRWRAARFLYEAGDEQAVPALKQAAEDPEFEVRMQARIALERIEGGHAAEGSVWQQMTRRNEA
ncbi:PBS lyase HEAT-like repeat-containing protein [Paenibacillus sp. UNCCL117]|uniref:conserved virulence factor C family protein n=1 Tax=unclassified Paenibacillus TaxID=185978 RepID=UPI0008886293|nr:MULTISPECIES: conserved virulence factor C family protein [unclassified Paenibacillus]SDD78866.1 PBS lyase HEAT-like repeat-containing protein [Paenibacillus sp. cl123]SFW53065.1 PBS lyase HEAT-like repeat-containing protein [Paenibacillus sp. UNCCL117]